MATGTFVEFVPARQPEVIHMDVSEYKIIKPNSSLLERHDDESLVAESDSGTSSSESEEDGSLEESDESSTVGSISSEDPELDKSANDSASASESDDDGLNEDENEDEDDNEEYIPPGALPFQSQTESRENSPPQYLLSEGNSGPASSSTSIMNGNVNGQIALSSSVKFFDINENINDRGTRPPHRIYKSWHPTAKAPAGLENRGVTCYQNAAVQALLHVPAVSRYLLEILNGQHPKVAKTSVTYELAVLLKRLMERRSAVFPSRLIRRLPDINIMLNEWSQEDSHEYYMSLMSRLQEDSVPRGEKLRSSIICDIFGGSVEQKVTCLKCRTVSTTNQDFFDLPVSFSAREFSGKYTLEQSVKDFFTPEMINGAAGSGSGGYQCEKCKIQTNAVKQIAIEEAPEYLTVHIKRFKMEGNVSKKVKDTMSYPIEMDLTQFETPARKEQPLRYKLISAIIHEGRTLSSGHYIALTRQPSNDWVVYDDEQVRRISEREVPSNTSAYILIYSRLLKKPEPKQKRTKPKFVAESPQPSPKKAKTSKVAKATLVGKASKTATKIAPKTTKLTKAAPKVKPTKVTKMTSKVPSKAINTSAKVSKAIALATDKSRTLKQVDKRQNADAIDDIFSMQRKTKY